jgi:hypothetical protein
MVFASSYNKSENLRRRVVRKSRSMRRICTFALLVSAFALTSCVVEQEIRTGLSNFKERLSLASSGDGQKVVASQ